MKILLGFILVQLTSIICLAQSYGPPLTEAQILIIKPRLDYMKSVKDTIDNYLETFLGHQKIELHELNCFSDFHLTFGTDGKLKKVETFELDKTALIKSIGRKEYLADKREKRKCKIKIRKILKGADLDFLHLKYEIYRTITFDIDNKILLMDKTMYFRDTK